MSGRTREALGWGIVAGWLLAPSMAWAAVSLPQGSVLDKPGYVQAGHAAYSTVLPGYCTTINLVDQLASPMQGEFHGTVTSMAYRNPAGGLTFTYVFSNTGPSTDSAIAAASFRHADWLTATISDAGSDGTGSSGTHTTAEWVDGDPFSIGLGLDGLLEFDFQVGLSGTLIGTVIGPGDHSATIWLETDAIHPRTSTVSLIDGAVGQAAVLVAPEPASLVLLVLAAAGVRRRRS